MNIQKCQTLKSPEFVVVADSNGRKSKLVSVGYLHIHGLWILEVFNQVVQIEVQEAGHRDTDDENPDNPGKRRKR